MVGCAPPSLSSAAIVVYCLTYALVQGRLLLLLQRQLLLVVIGLMAMTTDQGYSKSS